jgi:hypothetical protein
MSELPADVARFVRGETDPATFTHREHVRMAFELLRHSDFPEAALRYSRALQALTLRAGVPEKFHQTITVAFLALIAERLFEHDTDTFDTFAQDHPDLFDRSVLERRYGPERLASAAARTTFLLPTTPTR